VDVVVHNFRRVFCCLSWLRFVFVVSAQGSENRRNLAEIFDLFDYFVFFLSNCTRVLYCFSSETE